MNKIKIIHCTSVHDPIDPRILIKEITQLQENGYQVVYISKNEPRLDAFQQIIKEAIGEYSSISGRFITSFIKPLPKIWKHRDARLFHYHDPELYFVAIFARILGMRTIFDMHEDVPSQILTKTWLPKSFRSAFSKIYALFEKFIVRTVSKVITVTPPIQKRIGMKNAVLIRNFPIKNELITPKELLIPYKDRDDSIIYVGQASPYRGLDIMFNYLTSIKHKFSNFYFLGRIIPDSKTEYYKNQPIWEKTTYIHPATREQIKEYLNLSKIGLVLLPDTANNRLGYSTKLFEYMIAGLPVIVSNLPLNAGIVQKHNCGIIIDLNDEKEFINAVDTLLSNPELAHKMGEAGKKAVLTNYCWEHEGKKLLNLYNSLLKNG